MTSHYNVRLSALVAGQKCEFETNFVLSYQHLVITRANFHRVTLGDLQPKLVDFYHSIMLYSPPLLTTQIAQYKHVRTGICWTCRSWSYMFEQFWFWSNIFVLTCLILPGHVWSCPDMFDLVQTCVILPGHVWSCTDMFDPVRTCLILSGCPCLRTCASWRPAGRRGARTGGAPPSSGYSPAPGGGGAGVEGVQG